VLLHFIIFKRHTIMSGNAALSAARKRRASSNQISPTNGTPTTQYYGKPSSTVQQLMNQKFTSENSMTPEKVIYPPMNIYENIELIKRQLMERAKFIQMQGSALPAEKLRILQKQNEIQTQILKQKMAIAQQMELAEREQQELVYRHSGVGGGSTPMTSVPLPGASSAPPPPFIVPSINEPEFIYEKGIPRKNPRYKSPAEIEALRQSALLTETNSKNLLQFYQILVLFRLLWLC